MVAITPDEVLDALRAVLDPEVPALSVVDLGIVRDVRVDEATGAVTVDITPTYSGCPAMRQIEDDITAALRARGAEAVRVRTVYAPAWTTDWLTDEAKAKLRAWGIAPPGRAEPDAVELVPLRRRRDALACPFCGSTDTALRSEFGPTACKSIAYCNACQQPFEAFKAI